LKTRSFAALRTITVIALGAIIVIGCRQDMHNQTKMKPYRPSRFFADGQGSRPPVADTVARGQLRENEVYYTGQTADGEMVAEIPVPVTREVLVRGQQRFNIFCAPCHGRLGDGHGMVARRGYKQPASMHDPRLVASPAGYFYDVMTNGFAVMPSYATQIPPADRWAIVAYVRALQLSQGARLAELPAQDRDAVAQAQAAPAAAAEPAPGHGAEGH
jgi:mono/diheme cytochrome c family protein